MYLVFYIKILISVEMTDHLCEVLLLGQNVEYTIVFGGGTHKF